MDHIYTVESRSLQIVLEPIFDLDVGFVWPLRGIRLFGSAIPWDTMRMLYLHGGCL